ncbi:MAG TPA: DMT family transporter [Burkholderiales bacterium]|nr:DMT family transporter [Burkholderiales bacterium]
MTATDAARLVLLAAIWGASFLFVRIAAPVIGPVATADLRMLIAGAALLAYYAVTGFDAQWRLRWRQYLAIGVLNSAVPFLLYAYAALELSVGLLAVLNATSPMWAALLGIVALREALTKRRLAGLIVGMAGVAIVSGPEASTRWLSIAAGLGAALCYALTGIALKRWGHGAPARGMAVGTQLTGGLLLLPLLAISPPGNITPGVAGAMLALGVVCGALAYVLYFRLVADIGATGALTVTYLIPLFGILWGALALGEALTAARVLGAIVVTLGTVLVLRG